MTTFNTRSATNTNAQADREPAKFYLNFYAGNIQLGYIVLDEHPQIVEFLKNNPEDGTARMLANITATFREAGTKRQADISNW